MRRDNDADEVTLGRRQNSAGCRSQWRPLGWRHVAVAFGTWGVTVQLTAGHSEVKSIDRDYRASN